MQVSAKYNCSTDEARVCKLQNEQASLHSVCKFLKSFMFGYVKHVCAAEVMDCPLELMKKKIFLFIFLAQDNHTPVFMDSNDFAGLDSKQVVRNAF